MQLKAAAGSRKTRSLELTISRSIIFLHPIESALHAQHHWNVLEDFRTSGIGRSTEGSYQFGGDLRNPIRRRAHQHLHDAVLGKVDCELQGLQSAVD